jgi:hypothetical protein
MPITSSWDNNQAWYPGFIGHNVVVCQIMWNNRTQQYRPGLSCDLQSTSHWYGVTNRADYNAKVYIHPNVCCAHTIWGYAVA